MKNIHSFLTFNEMVRNINEGLIQTRDLDSTIDGLKRNLIGSKLKYEIEKESLRNTFQLIIKDFNYLERVRPKLELLESYITNISGYFPSVVCITNLLNQDNYKTWSDNTYEYLIRNSSDISEIQIKYESKFDKEIDIQEYEYVYHLTNKIYLDKILRNGLLVKTKSKLSYHPNRIYLTYSIENCEHLHKKMKRFVWEEEDKFPKTNKTEEFVVLKIDTTNLNNTFRNDPNFNDDGFYTTTNIKKENIIDVIYL